MATEKPPARPLLLLRAVLYWFFFVSTVAVCGSVIIIGFAAPYRWRYAVNRLWARVNTQAMKTICGLKHVVEGRENIPDTPVIIFSKHQSTYETLVLPTIFDPVSWVLKRELLRIPVFGWALALVGPTAIDRKAGSRAVDQVVKQGSRSLQAGRWVVIFPEGTRKAPGSPAHYRVGGAILAAKSGYPVLPVAHNAGEFWPKGRFLKWPGTVTFSIGPLINSENKSADEILNLAKDWIEGKMEQISDPARWNR